MAKSLRPLWFVTKPLCLFPLLIFVRSVGAQNESHKNRGVAKSTLVRIIRAEDERRWDNELQSLLTNNNPAIRKRALLAAGRIGDERAVPFLTDRLSKDTNADVQAMAAFALGEIESATSTEALIKELGNRSPEVRGRVVEALGKIVAATPKEQEPTTTEAKKAILRVLEFEAGRRSAPDRKVILLSLTAALRARPEAAGKVIAKFLTYSDARIRADVANALARLRVSDGNERLRVLLSSDPDPIVRANAARVLGATEDKESLDLLLTRATTDRDQRVRVSAIRALAALGEPGVAHKLMEYAGGIPTTPATSHRTIDGVNTTRIQDLSELLELATTVGRLLQGSADTTAVSWLNELFWIFGGPAPEVAVALVRISPEQYLARLGTNPNRSAQEAILTDWRAASVLAQALGEIANLPETTKHKADLSKRAQEILRAVLDYRNSGLNINTLVAVHSEYAVPDVLRAYAAHKPMDLAPLLRKHLGDSDVVVRATAAELLGELPPDKENTAALIAALPIALQDEKLNDAALSIVESLGKQGTASAEAAIRTALKSTDHLVRRRALAVLKANGVGEITNEIGVVQTQNRSADYERAISRIGKRVVATVKTTRGEFRIQLMPEEAPLTVDNFVQLARRGYFDRIRFHRVVPNFVIQAGDPRGDGNGGPGYSIRCEINELQYDSGAVGMALSGKDTGGSQWFVTHSPQPHLNGGYTVFGRVIQGMGVVNSIVRGDSIVSVSVTEAPTSHTRL